MDKEMMGEKEFFDLMKRANRDLSMHERGVIWELTRLIIKGDLAKGNKMIKIVDKREVKKKIIITSTITSTIYKKEENNE